MPIDDFSLDKPDAVPNAATTPGKYIKLVVPDFSDTVTNTNPNTMAPTPLSSYLRLGAVEDVAKAGKTTGLVGLITDMAGNPLVADQNAAFNPSYDPYAPFGGTNLPQDGKTPIPPATTPGGELSLPPKGAAAYPAAAGPDPTGEDLASLVQGFADDTRNRGKPRMTWGDAVPGFPNKPGPFTPGGQPLDPGTTAQGPLYGYPWVPPVMGAKAPGQVDASNTSTTEDPAYTASSKPVFFPDDYRTLESSQLHTKGGWRDHTDGNRITTTRGDKVEVIRGNYKLLVLGRQDQTKPKYAGMDLSGGQTVTGSTDLAADASTDFNQGSTAYSSLFEWRQCSTQKLFNDAVKAAANDLNLNLWLGQAQQDQIAAEQAQQKLNAAMVAAQGTADPKGYLQATIAAAQQMVNVATINTQATTAAAAAAQAATAAAALGAAKKALLTAEQAVDPNLLEGTAMAVLAATALPLTDATAAATATAAANAAAMTAWTATATPAVPPAPQALGVADSAAKASALDQIAKASNTWADAFAAWAAWTGTGVDPITGAANAAFAADTANAANAATAAAAAAAAAAAQAAAAAAAADAAGAADAASDAAHWAADPAAATAAAQAATAAQAAADTAAQAKADAATVLTAALATAAKGALAAWTSSVPAAAAAKTAASAAKAAAKADMAVQANPTDPSLQQAAATADALAAQTAKAAANAAANLTPSTQAANAANAAVLMATLAQTTPPGLNLTDAAALAWANAAYSTGMAEAAAIAAGLFTSPLDTLQLWEDGDDGPSDYRSVSTTKKGSGPKVQVKYQADPSGLYTQDGKKTPGVPGDGVTYALPISMGVSINETWSYQIYNYSGIGYYPATAPQPWPPPPPKTQSQPVGLVNKQHQPGVFGPGTLAGTGLPAAAPTRTPDPPASWSPVPQWVIYPVSKIVNKSYVLQQSTEVFAQRTVAITAGVRPQDPSLPPGSIDPQSPQRTYPSDVPSWVNVAGKPAKSYVDTAGNPQTLPATPTYDRNLLKELQFPDDATLAAWILDSGSPVLNIRDYNMIDQTWTETHVKNQATIVRAQNTLSDTVVGSQNTKVRATASTTNTAVTGQQHTILHAGSTFSETWVGDQTTHVTAASSTTETHVAGEQHSSVHATTIISESMAVSNLSTSINALSFALKLFAIDLQVAAGVHVGVNVGATFDAVVGPHLQLKILEIKAATQKMEILGGKTTISAGANNSLAPVHNKA